MKKPVVLLGPGRLGQAVCRLLHKSGYEIRAIISRDLSRAKEAALFAGCPDAATTDLTKIREGELVLLSLPDDHIGEMAKKLRKQSLLHPEAVLIHFSGLHCAELLQDKEDASPPALSVHPLQTFADAESGAASLPGSPFSVEGTNHALPLGEELVRDLGGKPFRIKSEQKALYHAAACIASNYQVALAAMARDVMASCGFDEETAFDLLSPLMETTAKNLRALGPEKALTGPIARGDVKTVEKHLEAMKPLPEELKKIYRLMGEKTVEVAQKKGTLVPENQNEILELLREI